MNRTGIKKMLTTTVLAAMAVLLVFSASATAVEVDVEVAESSFNVGSQGVLPVVILGNASNDVCNVTNVTTILLNATNGTNVTCAPIRHSCNDTNLDGIMDLVLKFDAVCVAECLPEEVENGDIVTLVLTGELLTGELLDGTPGTSIEGSDDVRVLIKDNSKSKSK